MSDIGKQIVEALETLVADTKSIPEGTPILEGLADKGYHITRVVLTPNLDEN